MKTTFWFGLSALAITLALAGCTKVDKKGSVKEEPSTEGQLVTVAVPGMT